MNEHGTREDVARRADLFERFGLKKSSAHSGVLSLSDTAKLVRRALREAFPGVKFSVRSESFSMGSSVRVRWTDGPSGCEVEDVVGSWGYGRFDGMTDSSYSVRHAMRPDGTLFVYKSSGGGVCPGWENDLGPDAVPVHSGTKYVGTSRDVSREMRQAAAERLAATGAWPGLLTDPSDPRFNYERPWDRLNEEGESTGWWRQHESHGDLVHRYLAGDEQLHEEVARCRVEAEGAAEALDDPTSPLSVALDAAMEAAEAEPEPEPEPEPEAEPEAEASTFSRDDYDRTRAFLDGLRWRAMDANPDPADREAARMTLRSLRADP